MQVSAAHQQVLLQRNKRIIVHDKQVELPIRHVEDKTIYERHPPQPLARSRIPDKGMEMFLDFSDPFYVDQWYLVSKRSSISKTSTWEFSVLTFIWF